VGLRAGLDDVERRNILPLPGLELRILGRPARSQFLYRLRYPVSWCNSFKTGCSLQANPNKTHKFYGEHLTKYLYRGSFLVLVTNYSVLSFGAVDSFLL
jgi:hypothetical protein